MLLVIHSVFFILLWKEATYEEIQERPQNSGTTMKTIYVTASFPTKLSAASHDHSNISFKNSSGEVSGDTYSTVRDNDQHPTYSTVSQPSAFSENPLYYTTNKHWANEAVFASFFFLMRFFFNSNQDLEITGFIILFTLIQGSVIGQMSWYTPCCKFCNQQCSLTKKDNWVKSTFLNNIHLNR